jgi:putative copper resistance protein D
MSLVLLRGLFVGCALSGFGAALFATTLMLPVVEGLDARSRRLIEERVRSVMRLSLAAAPPIAVAWFILEAQDMAAASTPAETVAAIPDVLLHTSFGRVLAVQSLAIAGALAATAVIRWPNLLALGLAGVAVLLEAAHSHSYAMADAALLLSQALHLLASGAWLGALIPLLIVVRDAPLPMAALTARRFATLGSMSVTVLVMTALFQGVELSGGFRGLTRTAYGGVLLIKVALFMLLVALAALNRFRLTPLLVGAGGEKARRALTASIAAETIIGLLVVLAASVLSSLEPGMHMTVS